MRLSREVAAHAGIFLDLEATASAAYNEFVYADRAEAERVRTLLFDSQVAEFSAPFSHVAVEGDAVVGIVSCLSGPALLKCRLRSAFTLNRSGVFEGNAGLRTRLELAGATLIRPEATDFYLSRIAVIPAAAGRGYGARLLEWVESEARNSNADRIVLEVDADNHPAIALYERHAFQQLGRIAVVDPDTGRRLDYLQLFKVLA